jgi:hypothetical protein
MTQYSRQNPSPRYLELLGYYREMHEHGAKKENIEANHTFNGESLGNHVDDIQRTASVLGSNTILDYGSGKGALYNATKITTPNGQTFDGLGHYWGVDSIICYDPGHAPFSQLPAASFDGVICTDVLEHCPKEDIPWILEEIFGFATEFVYLCVACFPAKKTLPNGENAHCTIEPPQWWLAQFNEQVKKRPGLRYFAVLETPDPDATDDATIVQFKYQGKWNSV